MEDDSDDDEESLSEEGEESSMQIDTVVADDASVASSLEFGDADDNEYRMMIQLIAQCEDLNDFLDEERTDLKSFSREDWEYLPELNRQSLLRNICDNNRSAGDLSVIEISKRGTSPKDVMKNFFLVRVCV